METVGDDMKRCLHCFGLYGDEFYICPHCGTVESYEPKEPIYLYPGTVLNDRYLIGEALGAGGFGIVYRAWDSKLDTVIAIKEYFPQGIATRSPGDQLLHVISKRKDEFEYRKSRFLLEARAMARFGMHKNIPNVFEYFEANNSAYIVMELLIGQQLNEYINQLPYGRVTVDFAVYVANEVGQALKSMHEAKIIHRDVAPDNIFICSGTEIQIKLMDLGAAKIENSSDDVIDLCMKVGYSPVEQYEKTDNFGPWSDIYALGATMYFMLTGVKPFESTSRKKEDMLQNVGKLNPEVSENLNNAIMKALAVNANERFSNVDDFLKAINGEKKIQPIEKERRQRKLKVALGILAALIVLTIGIVFGAEQFKDKRTERYLKPAKIAIWYYENDDNPLEKQSLETIRQSFLNQEGYEKVEIDFVAYTDWNKYKSDLEKASKEGTLPALFESTDLDDKLLQQAHSARKVIETAEECPLLKQYDAYYSDDKRIPMAIEVPVAYVLTKGASDNVYVMDYQKPFFEKDTFSKNTVYYQDDHDILEKNQLIRNSTVFDSEKNDWSVLFATTSSFNAIKVGLADKWYAMKMVFLKEDEIHCAFTYEWSIGNGTVEEINAAEHFASWMLGANAEVNLLGATGMIPINDNARKQKASDVNWSPVMEISEDFIFDEK